MLGSLKVRVAVTVVGVVGLSAVAPMAASAWTIEDTRSQVRLEQLDVHPTIEPGAVVRTLSRHVDPLMLNEVN